MTLIRIERVQPGRLRCQRWEFTAEIGYTAEIRVRLYDYRTMTRPTTRHKWRTTTGLDTNFNKHDNRGYRDGNGLPREKVPMPDDVKEQVKATLLSWVVFDTEGETNR